MVIEPAAEQSAATRGYPQTPSTATMSPTRSPFAQPVEGAPEEAQLDALPAFSDLVQRSVFADIRHKFVRHYDFKRCIRWDASLGSATTKAPKEGKMDGRGDALCSDDSRAEMAHDIFCMRCMKPWSGAGAPDASCPA